MRPQTVYTPRCALPLPTCLIKVPPLGVICEDCRALAPSGEPPGGRSMVGLLSWLKKGYLSHCDVTVYVRVCVCIYILKQVCGHLLHGKQCAWHLGVEAAATVSTSRGSLAWCLKAQTGVVFWVVPQVSLLLYDPEHITSLCFSFLICKGGIILGLWQGLYGLMCVQHLE